MRQLLKYITDAWVDYLPIKYCVDFNLFVKIHLLKIYDFNSLYSFKRSNYKKVQRRDSNAGDDSIDGGFLFVPNLNCKE